MKQRLKRQQSPATPHSSVTIALIITGTLVEALSGMMGNLASAAIPSWLKPYLFFAWLVFGVLVLLCIIIAVWRHLYTSDQSTNASPALPQPTISYAGASSLSSSSSQAASTQSTLISANTLAGLVQPASAPMTLPMTSSTPEPGSSLYHSCVLSYATEDEQFVKKLYADLQAQSVPCWLAEQDGRIGNNLRGEIYSAIDKHDKLLLVLSQHAIQSVWVQEEFDAALDREHRNPGLSLLFPIRLDELVFTVDNNYLATLIRQRRIGDFRQWQDDGAYQQALQRLLRDLHV